MLVYRNKETIEYVKKVNFLRKIQTSQLNSSRILRVRVRVRVIIMVVNGRGLVVNRDAWL